MRNVKMTLCAVALAMTSASALAAGAPGQGTVTFNGKLIAETCTVDPSSVDIQVTLPTLSAQTFNAAGVESGSKGFDIKVINCDPSITKVAAHFEAIGGSGTDSTTGNLTNQATTNAAQNVQVRIYNSDEKQLKLGETGIAATVAADHSATMRYYGGYYSTAAATAGDVNAKAMYTIAYP